MTLNRVTEGVNFNVGISTAEYNEAPAGQTKGATQSTVLPGSTTVSEALDEVFPKDPTVDGAILCMLAAEGAATALRTAGGFRMATRKAIRTLHKKKSAAAQAAVIELETLLADNELLDFYRASLLES